MWLVPGAWLAPEVVTPKQGSTPAAWGSGNPCPLGAVGREWGPQVRPPIHKRFSRICRSCCRLLHPRLREASGQQGQWTAVQKPCRAVRCWRGKEPGSERGAALAAPATPHRSSSITWRRGHHRDHRSSWSIGRHRPEWPAGRHSSPGRARGPAHT